MTKTAHAAHPLAPHLAREQRTGPVPPQPHRLMADVDPALEQQILYVPQRQSTTNRITSGDELK